MPKDVSLIGLVGVVLCLLAVMDEDLIEVDYISHSYIRHALMVPVSPLESFRTGDGPMSVIVWGTLPPSLDLVDRPRGPPPPITSSLPGLGPPGDWCLNLTGTVFAGLFAMPSQDMLDLFTLLGHTFSSKNRP
jgi:hypothetical protein